MTPLDMPEGGNLKPRARRVLVSWERGSGGPVVSAAGVLTLAVGANVYPRNGYLDLQADWPERRRIVILNRRVIDVLELSEGEDPQLVAQRAGRGDVRWP